LVLAPRSSLETAFADRQRSLTHDALRRLVANKAALAGLACITLVIVLALLATLVAPHPPAHQDLGATYARPGGEYWLGTDRLGRDLLSRTLYGARVSMSVAIVSVVLVVLVGVPVGLLSGYFGGTLDLLLMRLVDAMYAFPDLLLIIIVTTWMNAALGEAEGGLTGAVSQLYDWSGGLLAVIIALAMFGWLSLSRLARGQALAIRNREYILAAEAVGASHWRILWAYILPNALAPLIIMVALLVPGFIFAEAGLSFIGLGAQPPAASWGNMISEGVPAIQAHPHVLIVPGAMLSLTLLAFNFLGDGLRDALDPFMQ
jgi:ABC-type dipeptide/oligopeptide/nickel transport system permease subunit